MTSELATKLGLVAVAIAAIISACFARGDLATALVGIAGTAVGALGGVSVQKKVNGED